MKFGKEFFKFALLTIALAVADVALKHYGIGSLNLFAMAFGAYYGCMVYYKYKIKQLTK